MVMIDSACILMQARILARNRELLAAQQQQTMPDSGDSTSSSDSVVTAMNTLRRSTLSPSPDNGRLATCKSLKGCVGFALQGSPRMDLVLPELQMQVPDMSARQLGRSLSRSSRLSTSMKMRESEHVVK